jgi:hypothetical protein
MLLFVVIAFSLNAQRVPDWAVGTWIDDGHTITITAIGKLFDSDGYDFDNPQVDGNRIFYSNRSVRITRTNNPNQIKYAVSDGREWSEWTYTKVGSQAQQSQTTSQPAPTQLAPQKSTVTQSIPEWARGRWGASNRIITITETHLLFVTTGSVKVEWRFDLERIDPNGAIWLKHQLFDNISYYRVQQSSNANQIRVFIEDNPQATSRATEVVYTRIN